MSEDTAIFDPLQLRLQSASAVSHQQTFQLFQQHDIPRKGNRSNEMSAHGVMILQRRSFIILVSYSKQQAASRRYCSKGLPAVDIGASVLYVS